MNKRKVIRGILFLLTVPMAAMGVFIGFHRISLQIERRKFPPIGKLVEVNGHQMHVYSEGEGGETLVFLSGSGTAAPALDFKALYSRLSSRYRIAVVERAGYGSVSYTHLDMYKRQVFLSGSRMYSGQEWNIFGFSAFPSSLR